MAASLHELILARVKAALAAGNTGAARVERGRVDAFSPEEAPAINVRRSTGTHNEFAQGNDHGYFEFELDHLVRSSDWETEADALHMAAHLVLAGDAELATLGQGLRCIRTQPRAEPGDETVGCITATYQMQALVRITNLTKAVR